ncbi:MAG TPA: ferrous iron transporter B, partial [Chitinophagales bacterium]|nr:ferrous iron transporter B [Chitinophagales bacterium]
MAEKIRKIALLGNPNAGKSSLFNQLTGMRQKVGNFPGVTVERKSGIIKLENKQEVEIIDLPGTYSLYPTSMDERIAVNALIDSSNKDYPDAIIYIIDITQLERHLLLLTQIMDLGFPIIVALNMNDIAATQNLQCDEQKLAALLGIDIVKVNGRTGEGISKIKSKLSILGTINSIQKYNASFYSLTDKEQKIAEEVKLSFKVRNNYHALLLLQQHKKSSFLSSAEKSILTNLVQQYQFNLLDHQLEEIMQRYNRFTPVVAKTLSRTITEAKTLTDKVDTIITHKVFGPIIFFTLMLFIFQAIFSWSSIPMDWIDGEFAQLATYFQAILPHNLFTRLLTEGLIPGISGVMVFVPQITILFLLITILEEVGYMSRVVFMFDNIMQRFGLNGRSIVALISGGAC